MEQFVLVFLFVLFSQFRLKFFCKSWSICQLLLTLPTPYTIQLKQGPPETNNQLKHTPNSKQTHVPMGVLMSRAPLVLDPNGSNQSTSQVSSYTIYHPLSFKKSLCLWQLEKWQQGHAQSDLRDPPDMRHGVIVLQGPH